MLRTVMLGSGLLKPWLLGWLLAASWVTSAAAVEDFDGTWKLRLSFGGRGSRISILKLERRGDELTGVMLGSQGSQTAIEQARIQEGELSFELSREWGGRKSTSRYSGRLVEDTIEGTTQFEFRGRRRTWNWMATRTSSEPVTQAAEAPAVAADIDLTDENYQAWRDHILPETDELAWQQIPWLTTFKDGILAAATAGKPVLLWTMNGHPLGCT
jgi:hypothetical protein